MIEEGDRDKVLEALQIYNDACRKVEDKNDQTDDKE